MITVLKTKGKETIKAKEVSFSSKVSKIKRKLFNYNIYLEDGRIVKIPKHNVSSVIHL